MPEEEAPLVVQSERYKESDEHIPSPVDQYGTLDTSGTGGAANSRLEEISPIFDVAKKQDIQVAARALDPEDDEVPASLVVLPEGSQIVQGDPEGARKRIENAAAAARREPVVLGGETAAQEEAAESGEDAALKAQAQQEQQGAGSIGTGGVDSEGRKEAKEDAKDAKAANAKKVDAKKDATK